MPNDTLGPRPDPAANPPEPTMVQENPARRPKSGVFGFGATASTYFIAVAVLFIIFLVVILLVR